MMVPALVIIIPGSIVSVTPEFTIQNSPLDIVASEVIVVSVVNVIDAASASFVVEIKRMPTMENNNTSERMIFPAVQTVTILS